MAAIFFGLRLTLAGFPHWIPPLLAASVSIVVAAESKTKLIRRATACGALAAVFVALVLLTEFSRQMPEYLNWRKPDDWKIFAGVSLFHAGIGAAVGASIGAVIRLARS